MLFIAFDIWKYIILPYITKPLYGKILCLNEELNDYCQEGITTINIRISANKEELLKWSARKGIYITLGLRYNSGITDESLKLLINLQTLDLYNRPAGRPVSRTTITDEMIILLKQRGVAASKF
jgi:hypothetical protein